MLPEITLNWFLENPSCHHMGYYGKRGECTALLWSFSRTRTQHTLWCYYCI